MAPDLQGMGGGGDDKRRTVHEEVPLVHKVHVPPRGGLVKDVSHGLWETFFHDAPLRQFKGQSKHSKSWLGLKFVFPLLEWITTYTPRMFVSDFIAGLTIASLAIPQVPPKLTASVLGSLRTDKISKLMFFERRRRSITKTT